jgi:hypothetical protein
LFDLEHLEFGFSLSLGDFMLSLQSCNISSGSSFFGGGSLTFLDCLSLKELLLQSLGLKSFSSFFLLKFIEFSSSLLRQILF